MGLPEKSMNSIKPKASNPPYFLSLAENEFHIP